MSENNLKTKKVINLGPSGRAMAHPRSKTPAWTLKSSGPGTGAGTEVADQTTRFLDSRRLGSSPQPSSWSQSRGQPQPLPRLERSEVSHPGVAKVGGVAVPMDRPET